MKGTETIIEGHADVRRGLVGFDVFRLSFILPRCLGGGEGEVFGNDSTRRKPRKGSESENEDDGGIFHSLRRLENSTGVRRLVFQKSFP